MLEQATYLLFIIPPLLILTWVDIAKRGKINILWLVLALAYFIGIGYLFGFFPYTPLWLAAYVGIGCLVALYSLGWADRIFLGFAVIAVPAAGVLGILAFGCITYLMDRHGMRIKYALQNKEVPKDMYWPPRLSVELEKKPTDKPDTKPKYAFMPYILIGAVILVILTQVATYEYWSYSKSVGMVYGYNQYIPVYCNMTYSGKALSQPLSNITDQFGPRVAANIVQENDCWFALLSDYHNSSAYLDKNVTTTIPSNVIIGTIPTTVT